MMPLGMSVSTVTATTFIAAMHSGLLPMYPPICGQTTIIASEQTTRTGDPQTQRHKTSTLNPEPCSRCSLVPDPDCVRSIPDADLRFPQEAARADVERIQGSVIRPNECHVIDDARRAMDAVGRRPRPRRPQHVQRHVLTIQLEAEQRTRVGTDQDLPISRQNRRAFRCRVRVLVEPAHPDQPLHALRRRDIQALSCPVAALEIRLEPPERCNISPNKRRWTCSDIRICIKPSRWWGTAATANATMMSAVSNEFGENIDVLPCLPLLLFLALESASRVREGGGGQPVKRSTI
eukprot:695385-Rhodomonas_salina.2